MTRSTPEWKSKHPDQKVPPRVRLRVFERFGGVCQLSFRKIGPADKWDLDHIQALANGGEHRESNLQPALKEPHREKTRQDVAQKSKNARVRKKHLGLHQPKSRIPGSKGTGLRKRMDGTVVRVNE